MNPPRSDRAAFVVLGMHRSGTSALARTLAGMGADEPAHPIAGDEHNETGYYESWPIAVLNDQWLRSAGSAWDDPFAYPLPQLAQPQLEEWLAKASSAFDSEFGAARRPLLKDPRISLLAQEWLHLLDRKGVEPRCIVSVRAPAAVARSLQRRDGFTLERGVLIWISYMLASERYSRGRPRVFVGFEALLADAPAQARRIAQAFGDDSLAQAGAGEGLRPGLRHHAGEADPAELGVGGPLALRLFDWLERACGDWEAPEAEIDGLAAEFAALRDRVGGLITPIVRDLDRTRAELEFQRQLVGFQKERLEAEVRRLAGHLAELRDERDGLARQLAASAPPPQAATAERRPMTIDAGAAADKLLERFHDPDYRQVWLALDREFYVSRYPDVRGEDPVAHYLLNGWREGRDPNSWFSTNAYLEAKPQLRDLGLNPLVDFLRSGLSEPPPPIAETAPPPARLDGPSFDERRAAIEPYFDRDHYLDLYADIREAGQDPLEHYLQSGWREGRDPSPQFSTRHYLETYPEVAESGANPLHHYVTIGQALGYSPRPHLGWRYDVLERLQGVDQRIAWAAKKRGPVSLRDAGVLAQALGRAGAAHITVSHDDFSDRVGGVQLCIAREAAALTARGRSHIHIYPSVPSPVLSEDPDYALAVVVDRVFLGDFSATDLLAALPRALDGVPTTAAIHTLLGHEPGAISAILAACAPSDLFYWIHDFEGVCAGYTLLRNDVQFCGGPPPDSQACSLCIYGSHRRKHIDGYRLVFERLSPVLVAPAERTLQIWKDGGGPAGSREVVHPHAFLTPTGTARRRGDRTVVAFCGLPVSHKGWPAFRELAGRLRGDDRYEFFQLGDAMDASAMVDFRRVAIDPDHLDAMQTAIRELQADIVVIWSICPETFCLTACEALAAGAGLVAFADSGNAAAIAEGSGGVVLNSEAELFDFFASGTAAEFAAARTPTLHQMTLSQMSADLIP
ncbi:MAG: hypothetical protein ABW042_02985, partial [Phenylobacterium sp.]